MTAWRPAALAAAPMGRRARRRPRAGGARRVPWNPAPAIAAGPAGRSGTRRRHAVGGARRRRWPRRGRGGGADLGTGAAAGRPDRAGVGGVSSPRREPAARALGPAVPWPESDGPCAATAGGRGRTPAPLRTGPSRRREAWERAPARNVAASHHELTELVELMGPYGRPGRCGDPRLSSIGGAQPSHLSLIDKVNI